MEKNDIECRAPQLSGIQRLWPPVNCNIKDQKNAAGSGTSQDIMGSNGVSRCLSPGFETIDIGYSSTTNVILSKSIL